MNTATKLTLFRVLSIPLFLAAFLWRPQGNLEGDWGKVAAAAIFIVAAITDYYDGAVARWYKEETTFGKFMDPIADKILVSTALIAMVEFRALTFTPAWVAAIIIAREFAITGLRLICAQKGKIISADKAGKWKTTAQLTAIITCLVFIAFRVCIESYGAEAGFSWFTESYGVIVQILMFIAVIMTIYSGYDYFKKNQQYLFE